MYRPHGKGLQIDEPGWHINHPGLTCLLSMFRVLLRTAMPCIIFVLGIAVSEAGANEGFTDETKKIYIEIRDGELNLEARNAPLGKIIREIGLRAGFDTFLAEDFVDTSVVSVSFRGGTVVQAVHSLVQDVNRTIFYRPRQPGIINQVAISQIWLLGTSTAKTGVVNANVANIATAEETAVKSFKVTRLIEMLMPDQEENIRIRAAMALAVSADESAIPALESALQDANQTVRLQATKALSRIGSDEAITIIGNILLQSGVESAERVMAAEVLWLHDSDIAQSYLETGSFSSDKQVRLASVRPTTNSNFTNASSAIAGEAFAQ